MEQLGALVREETTLCGAVSVQRTRAKPRGSPQCSVSTRGDAATALSELEAAVAIAEKLLPPEHPHLKEYREALAKCMAALAEKDKAGGKKGGG